MLHRSDKRNLLLMAVLICVLCQTVVPFDCFAETYTEALKRGYQLRDDGDSDGAIGALVIAKSMAPNAFNDAAVVLARLYEKLGRYSEADAEYKAILGATNNLSIKEEYARFLTEQGKFNEASSYWSSMLAEYPNNQKALYYMGICCESEENLDQAKDYFKKAISISSQTTYGQYAAQKLARLEHQDANRNAAKSFPIDPETGPLGFGWWNLKKMPIHVYIDDGSDVPGYRSEMKSFVTSAMDAWRHASGGKFNFAIDPPDSQSESAWKASLGKTTDPILRMVMKKKLPADPVSAGIHVHWTDSLGGLALGLAWPNTLSTVSAKRAEAKAKDKGTASGADSENDKDDDDETLKGDEVEIKQVHIWLITSCLADGTALPKQITAANSAIIDKQNRMLAEVAIHEFGHALGLPHSNNPHDIMCSGIFALDSRDHLEARDLSKGDTGSLREHYNSYEEDPLKNSEVLTKTASGSANGKTPKISIDLKTAQPDKVGAAILGRTNISSSAANDQVSQLNAVMFDLNSKQYSSALQKLNQILQKQTNNFQAIYLRAVTNVMMHNYKDAGADYEAVIHASPDSALAKRAAEGLRKLKSN